MELNQPSPPLERESSFDSLFEGPAVLEDLQSSDVGHNADVHNHSGPHDFLFDNPPTPGGVYFSSGDSMHDDDLEHELLKALNDEDSDQNSHNSQISTTTPQLDHSKSLSSIGNAHLSAQEEEKGSEAPSTSPNFTFPEEQSYHVNGHSPRSLERPQKQAQEDDHYAHFRPHESPSCRVSCYQGSALGGNSSNGENRNGFLPPLAKAPHNPPSTNILVNTNSTISRSSLHPQSPSHSPAAPEQSHNHATDPSHHTVKGQFPSPYEDMQRGQPSQRKRLRVTNPEDAPRASSKRVKMSGPFLDDSDSDSDENEVSMTKLSAKTGTSNATNQEVKSDIATPKQPPVVSKKLNLERLKQAIHRTQNRSTTSANGPDSRNLPHKPTSTLKGSNERKFPEKPAATAKANFDSSDQRIPAVKNAPQVGNSRKLGGTLRPAADGTPSMPIKPPINQNPKPTITPAKKNNNNVGLPVQGTKYRNDTSISNLYRVDKDPRLHRSKQRQTPTEHSNRVTPAKDITQPGNETMKGSGAISAREMGKEMANGKSVVAKSGTIDDTSRPSLQQTQIPGIGAPLGKSEKRVTPANKNQSHPLKSKTQKPSKKIEKPTAMALENQPKETLSHRKSWNTPLSRSFKHFGPTVGIASGIPQTDSQRDKMVSLTSKSVPTGNFDTAKRVKIGGAPTSDITKPSASRSNSTVAGTVKHGASADEPMIHSTQLRRDDREPSRQSNETSEPSELAAEAENNLSSTDIWKIGVLDSQNDAKPSLETLPLNGQKPTTLNHQIRGEAGRNSKVNNSHPTLSNTSGLPHPHQSLSVPEPLKAVKKRPQATDPQPHPDNSRARNMSQGEAAPSLPYANDTMFPYTDSSKSEEKHEPVAGSARPSPEREALGANDSGIATQAVEEQFSETLHNRSRFVAAEDGAPPFPFFEYIVYQQLRLADSTNDHTRQKMSQTFQSVDDANAYAEDLIKGIQSSAAFYGVQYQDWRKQRTAQDCVSFSSTFITLTSETPTPPKQHNIWVEQYPVSRFEERLPDPKTPFINKNVYILRLSRLIIPDAVSPPSSPDPHESSSPMPLVPIHQYHPLPKPFSELYTTIAIANRAARRLQIHLSHTKDAGSPTERKWQEENNRKLVRMVTALEAKLDDGKDAYWQSAFNGLGGEKFELKVEMVALNGPRNF